MQNRLIIISTLLLSVLFISSCEKETKKKTPPPKKVTFAKAPIFNPDSAYEFIAKQVSFGPRVPNTQNHQICGDYFVETLEAFGADVTQQEFTVETYNGKTLPARNIIAAFNPELKKRVLLAAHWDSRPYADQDTVDILQPIDGVIDGAAGTGILLEIARAISNATEKLTVGVDIMLIDVEDYGAPASYDGERTENDYCLGSQYWAKEKHHPTYHAFYGILLDHVGTANAKFTMEGYSMKYAPKIIEKVWGTGERLGYSEYFIRKKTDPIVDDHIYLNQAGIPTIDIIQYDDSNGSPFFDQWHTHRDNLSLVDKKTLKALGQTLLQVVYDEGK